MTDHHLLGLFMRGLIAGVLCSAMSVSGALGQYAGGVNIDFNAASGAGSGQPTILFGGAAGQGGYWNAVNPPFSTGTTVQIRDPGNSFNAVTCRFTQLGGGGSGSYAFNNANTSDDVEKLMDDGHNLGTTGTAATYQFEQLQAGIYEVYTYAAAPDDATFRTRVVVRGSLISFPQEVGGAIPAAGVFTEGVTHAKHIMTLGNAGTLHIDVQTLSGFGSVAGIQIKRLNPTRLYVSPAAPTPGTTGNGLSWSTPLRSLTEALAIARATPSVTEVWVAEGVYLSDSYPEWTGAATATHRLRSNLAVYGGFAGTEATLAERPAFVGGVGGTGGAGGSILTGTFGGGGGSVTTVVTAEDVDSTAVLDGFVIANGGGTTPGNGGGIKVVNGSPVIRNCTIRNNNALDGGGLFVSGPGGVVLERCVLTENTAEVGSAVRSQAGMATTIWLHHCAVTRNTCTVGTAGTIGVWCNLNMTNCLIANNDNWSWIMDCSPAPYVTLLNCTLANNRATGQSGAAPNVGIALGGMNTLRNCVIFGNRAGDGGSPTTAGLLNFGPSSELEVSDSIVQGWDGTLAGPGFLNNGLDPRFVAPAAAGNTPGAAAADYRLASRSPGRDSGWNAAIGGGLDLDGLPRFRDDPFVVNTGFAGGTVDRGCYEAQTPSDPCPGDIGRAGGLPGADGLRDNNDFIAFISFFFALDPRGDLGVSGGFPGSDGLFDNNDFIAFIDLFFTACP